jgi:hypothetical protein
MRIDTVSGPYRDRIDFASELSPTRDAGGLGLTGPNRVRR